ncbi:MAG: hypothetical protein AAF517_07040, partial [Planctomycetota bacterium]
MSQRRPYVLAALLAVFVSPLQAWQEADPCENPELRAIFQSEASHLESPELNAAAIERAELQVEAGLADVPIALVSDFKAGIGATSWTVIVAMNGDGQLVDLHTRGTVAAPTSDDPPGLVQNGYTVTNIVDRPPYGWFGIASAVLSFQDPVTLLPRGTATIVQANVAGEDGERGTIRVFHRLDDLADWRAGPEVPAPEDPAVGGGGSLLPEYSGALVDGKIVELACVPTLDLVFRDTSGRCAQPPVDAVRALRFEWEYEHPKPFNGSMNAKSAIASGDGGFFVTGWRGVPAA